MQLLRTSVLTVGENKGTPRIWIEGKYLQMAGFEAGRKVTTRYGENEIIITLADDEGDHTVCSGRKAGRYPLLDYQNREIRSVLRDATRVEVRTAYGRITITPAILNSNVPPEHEMDRWVPSSAVAGCWMRLHDWRDTALSSPWRSTLITQTSGRATTVDTCFVDASVNSVSEVSHRLSFC